MQNKIIDKVTKLTLKYGTNEPEELCRRMNIVICDCELPQITKGFCITLSRGTAIMLNDTLNATERKYCIAHELGHAVMHSELNYLFMKQNTCMVIGKFEREADMFAAYLLLQNTEISESTTTLELAASTALPEWAVNEVTASL